MKKLYAVLLLFVSVFTTHAQPPSITSVSNPGLVYSCGSAVPVVLHLGTSSSLSLTVSVSLKPGYQVASSISSRPVSLNNTNPLQPVFTLTGPFAATDSLVYYMQAGCGAQGNVCQLLTQQIMDTVKLNGNFNTLTQPYFLKSPCLSFNVNEVTNYDFAGTKGDGFIRTTIVRNVGTSNFSGDLGFRVKHGGGILIDSVYAISSTGSPVNVISHVYAGDSIYYRANFSGISNTDYITLYERVKIISCLGGAEGNSSYSINYGCGGAPLCDKVAHAQTAVAREGNMNLSITPIPWTPATCYSGTRPSSVVIKNTGGALIESLLLKLNLPLAYYYHIDRSKVSLQLGNPSASHILAGSDSAFYQYNYIPAFKLTPCLVPKDSIINLKYYTIDHLYPGDSLVFSYEQNYCCPDANNPLAFRDMYVTSGVGVIADFRNDCGIAQNTVSQSAVTLQHSFTQLPIQPGKSDINAGEKLDVEVTNTGFNFFDPAGPYKVIDTSRSVLKIRLRFGPKLVFNPLTDTLEIRPKTGIPLLPFKVVSIGDALNFNGDTIEAYFKIPSSLYADYTTWSTFWINSSVAFRLTGICPSGYLFPASSTYSQDVFFIADTSCADCVAGLPLSSNSEKVFVHCPGCTVPGVVIKSFAMERTTLGEQDNDDNLLPDNAAIVKADPLNPKIKLNRAMIGDTLKATMKSYISDGTTYTYAGFFLPKGVQFRHAEYQFSLPDLSHLKLIGATVIFNRNTRYDTITYNLANVVHTGGTRLGFDLSIDTLVKMGFDSTGIPYYQPYDWFEVIPEFVVVENVFQTKGLYIAPLQGIYNYMYVTGVPVGTTGLGDVSILPPAQLDATREYWCEQHGGNFTLIGKRVAGTRITGVNNALDVNGRPNSCVKEVSTISAYNSYGLDIADLFPYEYRKVAMLDSTVYRVPLGYNLDSVYVGNEYVEKNTNGNPAFLYQQPSVKVTPNRSYVSGGHTYMVFDPQAWYKTFTGFTSTGTIGEFYYPDENYELKMRFFISPSCSSAPDSSTDHYFAATFEKLPGIAKDSTFATGSTGNGLASDLLLAPKPKLKLVPDSLQLQAQQKINCFVNLSLKNNSSDFNAPYPFVAVRSASGRFTLTDVHPVGDTIDYPNSNGVYRLPTVLKNGEENFKICGSIDCSASLSGDSITVYFGWGCGGFPASLATACHVDSNKYFIESPDAGIRIASATVQDTVSFLDTLDYRMVIRATGIGSIYNVKIKASLPAGGVLKYNNSLLQFPGDTTSNAAFVNISPYYFSKDSVVWYLDSLGALSKFFIEKGINGSNTASDSTYLQAEANFRFVVFCGFRKEQLKFDVTGVTYCGRPVGDTRLMKPVVLKGLTLPVAYAGTDTILCGPGVIPLGTAPVAGTHYKWTPAAGLSDDTLSNPTATVSATRQYILAATNVNGCVNRDTVQLTFNNATVDAGMDKTICAGNSVQIGVAPVPIIAGVVYSWSPTAGLSSTSAVTTNASPAVTTSYVLTATNGACVKKDTVVVNITPLPPTPVVTGTSQVCAGSQNVYTVQRVAGVTVSLLSLPVGATYTTVISPTVITYTVTVGTQSGNLLFRAVGAGGCIKDTSVVMTVSPSFTAPTIQANGPIICVMDSVRLSTNPIAGAQYQWFKDNVIIAGAASLSYNVTSSGAYKLLETIGVCSKFSNSISVSMGPALLARLRGSFYAEGSLCTATAVTFTNTIVNAKPGATYKWIFGPNATPNNFTGANPPSVSFNAAGNYTVTLKVNNNDGCDSIQTSLCVPISDCSCSLPAGFAPTVLGDATITKVFDGDKIFNGDYNVKGNLVFQNGIFTLKPGTRFNVTGLLRAQQKAEVPCNIDLVGYRITLVNATLIMNNAVITSYCTNMWEGIAMDNTTPITLSIKNSEISNSMYGLFDLDKTTALVAKVNVDVVSSNFRNNYNQHLYINNAGAKMPATSSIKGSTFITDPTLWKRPYSNLNQYNHYYTFYAVALSNGDYYDALISNNTITGAMYGFVADMKAKVHFKSNTINKCYTGITSSYYGDITSFALIENNVINMNSYFSNASLDRLGARLSSSTNFTGNTINGNIKPANSTSSEIGIECASPIIQGNNFNGTDVAISPTTLNEIYGNTFTNARTMVKINPLFYNPNQLLLRCNTFDRSGLSGKSFGIHVPIGAFLNDLGGAGVGSISDPAPNGNNFIGFTGQINQNTPMVYDGAQTDYNNFRYYRYKTPQEDIRVTSTQGVNIPIILTVGPVNTMIPAKGNTCPGTSGVSRISATPNLSAQDSVNTIMDSLRFQLGDFRKMKQWQYRIIGYHVENNKLSELEQYTDSLIDCNKEAYNTLGLFMMNNYHDQGQCGHAHTKKQELLNHNPSDKEIIARTSYFDYQCRQVCDTSHVPYSMPSFKMNPKDSIDLVNILNSATTPSKIASRILNLHYPEMNYQADTILYVPNYPDCGVGCKKKKASYLRKGWEKQTGLNTDRTGAQLSQNIPNPADNETIISYMIPSSERIVLKNTYIVIQSIVTGMEVKKIDITESGYNFVTVNLDMLPSGVYSYSLIVNGISKDVKRMVVLK